ncbi:MAG: triose-phosphate isomerase [Acidilobaceae archaeon]
MKRYLVVNFKAYESAFGEKALGIAREASRLSSRLSKTRIILAPPILVATKISQVYNDVYLQHVDPVSLGSYTGFIPVEALKIEGVRGSIVNHSEHKIKLRDLNTIILKARELDLEILACADTPEEAAAVAALEPTLIAIEPPELIGTGIPVSKAKPEVITRGLEAVRIIREIPVLAGAGISSGDDARRALELGASGVLVASMVMKAKNPGEALRELTEALESF